MEAASGTRKASSRSSRGGEDISLSDDELEPDSIEDDDSTGAPKNSAPPSYAELSSHFGPLEEYAEACGIREVGYLLRRAKMGFLAANAATPGRQ